MTTSVHSQVCGHIDPFPMGLGVSMCVTSPGGMTVRLELSMLRTVKDTSYKYINRYLQIKSDSLTFYLLQFNKPFVFLVSHLYAFAPFILCVMLR